MEPRRPSQGRRPPPPAAKGGLPVLAWMLLIGVPLIGIVTVAALKGPTLFFSEPPPKKVAKVEDPNQHLKDLEAQVRAISDEYNQVMKLAGTEDPAAKAKQDALTKRVDAWMMEWDKILNARRNADGRLPQELLGYQDVRARINQIRLDLLKTSSF